MPAAPSLPARLAHRVQRLVARVPRAGRQCVVCGARVGRFLPYRGGWADAPAVVVTQQVVGSDLDWYECPACGANDRERHLVHYFRALGLFDRLRGQSVLHFAPERGFAALVAAAGPRRHVRADLYPATPDVEKVDLLAIAYPDEAFDCVIANHVLEHVADDTRALAELHRVLRPGGLAILQTPYSAVLETTVSDPTVTAPADRLRLYGQEDHVRLYGRDIFARIAAAGFIDQVARHDDVLPGLDPRRAGVNRREPLFRFARR